MFFFNDGDEDQTDAPAADAPAGDDAPAAPAGDDAPAADAPAGDDADNSDDAPAV